jgi:hypothetical protein
VQAIVIAKTLHEGLDPADCSFVSLVVQQALNRLDLR